MIFTMGIQGPKLPWLYQCCPLLHVYLIKGECQPATYMELLGKCFGIHYRPLDCPIPKPTFSKLKHCSLMKIRLELNFAELEHIFDYLHKKITFNNQSMYYSK